MSINNARAAELIYQHQAMEDFIDANGLADQYEAFYDKRLIAHVSAELSEEMNKQLMRVEWAFVNAISHTVTSPSYRGLVKFLCNEYPDLVAYAPVIMRRITDTCMLPDEGGGDT